jgi:hypothetical protein
VVSAVFLRDGSSTSFGSFGLITQALNGKCNIDKLYNLLEIITSHKEVQPIETMENDVHLSKKK